MSKKYILLGSIAALVAGGAAYVYHQYKLIDKLCFNVVGYNIESFSSKGAKINLTLAVKNLGSLSIKIKKFKFNVFGDDKFLATAYSDTVLDIKPNKVGKTTVEIFLNPQDMISNIGSILQSSSSTGGWKNITLSMKGGINVQKGIIPFYIPITYKFKLSELTEGSEVESPC